MRVAISFWENGIAPVMDASSRFLILEIARRQVMSEHETRLDGSDSCGIFLQRLGVSVLICGAVSVEYEKAIRRSAITVIPFVTGTTKAVIAAFCAGSLESGRFDMPGFRRARRKSSSLCSPTQTRRRDA